MPVVVFDPAAWATRYPEFSSLDAGTAQRYFDEATLYLDNSETACIPVGPRTVLLNMLTAHIAQIYSGRDGAGGPSGVVGRVSSATEGSVSVGAEYSAESGTAAWYAQTPYGAAFWAATARYRTAHYLVTPRPIYGRGLYGRYWS